MRMRTGRDGIATWAACLAALLLLFACGEPSPEAQLEEAREALERARQKVSSVEARYEELTRKLEKVREEREEVAEKLEEAREEVAEARAEVGRFATDDAIFRALQTRLLNDEKLEEVAIPVRVNDGVVVLTGEVPDASLSRRAEELAAEVAGVVEVRNRIRVREGREASGQSEGSGSGSQGSGSGDAGEGKGDEASGGGGERSAPKE